MIPKTGAAQLLQAALMRDEAFADEPDRAATIVKGILMDLEDARLCIAPAAELERRGFIPPHRPCLVYSDSNAEMIYTLDDSNWVGSDLPGRESEFCQALLEQALSRFPARVQADKVAQHLEFLMRACYGVEVKLA
ncbi:hypothetical protein ACIBHX_01915 [Nonomuraea sp. NPDC050536]|uniref:hypothetical protein n=1 Tax=Nonomuraea sp. NPDC050536 TaxID=3364366 RepID=UPI0037C522D2